MELKAALVDLGQLSCLQPLGQYALQRYGPVGGNKGGSCCSCCRSSSSGSTSTIPSCYRWDRVRLSLVDNIPHFADYWDSWRKLDKQIASGESARRYFSTKEFIFRGVPNVFRPEIPTTDKRFFDPSNTWYIYDNSPLKESLEKFAKFPISTSFRIIQVK